MFEAKSKMIHYAQHETDDSDIAAVLKILTEGNLTQGSAVREFEESFARYVNVTDATAVNSGTAALHLACLVLGVGPGDHVWTSPISFVASANCALYCGAVVDFFDVDEAGLVDVDKLKNKLQLASKAGSSPKALVLVHYGGVSCDMKAVRKLADEFEFKIIEDACHALGGSYAGAKVGSCEFSDVSTFSFHPAKLITTAEGGMLTARDSSLTERARLLRTHGITRRGSELSGVVTYPWYYSQLELGFNYRMPDVLAALGASQLSRVEDFLLKRRELSQRYDKLLEDIPVRPVHKGRYQTSGCHLYVVVVSDGLEGKRDQIIEFLREMGIEANLHYQPIYSQPYFRSINKGIFCSNAEAFAKKIITLPLHTSLTEDQVQYIVESLSDATKRVLDE